MRARTPDHPRFPAFTAAALIFASVCCIKPAHVGAQNFNLPPGTDCQKVLYTERNDCIRLMRRYEMEKLLHDFDYRRHQPGLVVSPSPFAPAAPSAGAPGGSIGGGGGLGGLGGN